MDQLLNVKILTPKTVLFQGPAQSVSSKNSQGAFDILPEHANFITIIQNQPIIIRSKQEALTFNFSQAIVYNSNNSVSIFAEPLS